MLIALRAAGATVPRGLAPPAVLRDAVTLRAYPPTWIWWLLVPFGALAAWAVVDGAYLLAPGFVLLPLVGIGVVRLVLGTTTCAVDGAVVARPNAYPTSAFDAAQRPRTSGIDGLRFVLLYAKDGFRSPGFERLLARHVDPARTIVGRRAGDRVWPAGTPGPPERGPTGEESSTI